MGRITIFSEFYSQSEIIKYFELNLISRACLFCRSKVVGLQQIDECPKYIEYLWYIRLLHIKVDSSLNKNFKFRHLRNG